MSKIEVSKEVGDVSNFRYVYALTLKITILFRLVNLRVMTDEILEEKGKKYES
jgi:hypothetical protein